MSKVVVRTHHVSISVPIKTYAEEKIGKLEKYFDNIQEIIVELDYSDVSDESKRNIATAVVRASGTVIKAEEKAKDMYASIDGLAEKITNQLKKYKEKVKDPKRVKAQLSETPSGKAATAKSKPKAKVAGATAKGLKDPIFIKKPMMPEDAAAVLEEKGVQFVLFKNSETDIFSVLYPLPNGQLGLIEAE